MTLLGYSAESRYRKSRSRITADVHCMVSLGIGVQCLSTFLLQDVSLDVQRKLQQKILHIVSVN